MDQRRVRRVGHKGADAVAPGNTRASFDAAIAAGVDMIEFDVLPTQPHDSHSTLLLAHDYVDMEARTPLTLDEGLEHLASDAFAGIELDVDLKLPGYELRVLEALRRYGLAERTLISTQYLESLALLRAAGPEVRRGWSVPKLRSNPFRSPLTWPGAYVAMHLARLILPRHAARAIRCGAVHALMAHYLLVTPRLARAVDGAGGELYVWTVDELPRIRALVEIGVHGVISNDPRLFAALV
ncbi:MAG: glycerophosphodiester phosphodiesterase [Solirubrobacteraceae bacterium]